MAMKKSEAAIKAICLYLGMNAFIIVAVYVLRWLFTSRIGHWLEIDRPAKPYVPGFFLIYQIFLLMVAIFYYREKVKDD